MTGTGYLLRNIYSLQSENHDSPNIWGTGISSHTGHITWVLKGSMAATFVRVAGAEYSHSVGAHAATLSPHLPVMVSLSCLLLPVTPALGFMPLTGNRYATELW